MKPKAIVLMSGGIDSTTAAYIALKDGFDVYGLSINYGQKGVREIEQASKICDVAGILHFVVDLSSIESVIESPLTSEHLGLNLKKQEKTGGSYYIVPFRNAILLSVAVAFAQSVDADAIFMGTQLDDSLHFPDNSAPFLRSFQETIFQGTAKDIHRVPEIQVPLIDLVKSEVILKGIKLGVPYELTWSCYFGGELHCGVCESCVYRKRAFEKAGVKDPTKYEGGEINGIKKGNKNI